MEKVLVIIPTYNEVEIISYIIILYGIYLCENNNRDANY